MRSFIEKGTLTVCIRRGGLSATRLPRASAEDVNSADWFKMTALRSDDQRRLRLGSYGTGVNRYPPRPMVISSMKSPGAWGAPGPLRRKLSVGKRS